MYRILFLSLYLLCLSACKKDYYDFPDAKVNIFLYPNNAQYADLNPLGGWVYIEGGVNGILVFHDFLDNYIAYDRACTHEPTNPCERVSVESDNSTLACECCDSKFFLYDGSVTHGPAQYSLKRYNTSFDGVVLSIYN
jgi:nitrite reductase/ring-hydroxylating ferredoxin subunit